MHTVIHKQHQRLMVVNLDSSPSHICKCLATNVAHGQIQVKLTWVLWSITHSARICFAFSARVFFSWASKKSSSSPPVQLALLRNFRFQIEQGKLEITLDVHRPARTEQASDQVQLLVCFKTYLQCTKPFMKML